MAVTSRSTSDHRGGAQRQHEPRRAGHNRAALSVRARTSKAGLSVGQLRQETATGRGSLGAMEADAVSESRRCELSRPGARSSDGKGERGESTRQVRQHLANTSLSRMKPPRPALSYDDPHSCGCDMVG